MKKKSNGALVFCSIMCALCWFTGFIMSFSEYKSATYGVLACAVFESFIVISVAVNRAKQKKEEERQLELQRKKRELLIAAARVKIALDDVAESLETFSKSKTTTVSSEPSDLSFQTPRSSYWIQQTDGRRSETYVCAYCGLNRQKPSNYCPVCGKYMTKVQFDKQESKLKAPDRSTSKPAYTPVTYGYWTQRTHIAQNDEYECSRCGATYLAAYERCPSCNSTMTKIKYDPTWVDELEEWEAFL